MGKLKFSIITVVRNGMPYVDQTMDSVIGQSFPDIEYIVIDGASIDGTIDAIKRHERGIVKWISEPDAGIAEAFNKGLSFCSGDYIMILNADDALSNEHVLEQVADGLKNNNYPMIAYGDCDMLQRETGEYLYRAVIHYSKGGLLRGKMLPHPAMFVRREYFMKYGGFDPAFKVAMDYEWMLRGALDETVMRIPVVVSRVRSGGMSTQSRQRSVAEILAALKKNGRLSWDRNLLLRSYFWMRGMAAWLKRLVLYARHRVAGTAR